MGATQHCHMQQTLKVAPLRATVLLVAGVLLLFYATCISAEVSQHLVVEEASSRSLVDRGGQKCEAGTFDWTQCKSEGGTKQCASCKGGDGNGVLPCDKQPKGSSAACPDSKLWKGKFFNVNGLSGNGGCNTLSSPGSLGGSALTAYNFAGGICNSSAPEPPERNEGRNLVATKGFVGHPNKAPANVAVVMFKRLVMHRCTGIRPAFCKKGDNVADVFKQGFCVKCKPKKYDREGCGKKCEVFSCNNCGKETGNCGKKTGKFGKTSSCPNRQRCNQKTGSCWGFGTDEEKKAFLTQCLTDAFTPEGVMKDAYLCSREAMKYASASIA